MTTAPGDENTQTSSSIETPLSLEERKFASETELRNLELGLKAREVALKEKEIERSRLLNPTLIGLIAATLGLGGNIIVTFVGNRNAQKIEHSRAQASLIVQAVGTGNAETACKNLISFVKLGLLDDPSGSLSKCQTNLQAIPVLPVAQNYNVSSDFEGSNKALGVATRTIEGDRYKFTVTITVPKSILNNDKADLITVYAYQIDNAGNRSNDLSLPPISGHWQAGQRVTFTTELPLSYLADQSKQSYLRYCVGTAAACVPGGNLLVSK
jgi:hypothetical protein